MNQSMNRDTRQGQDEEEDGGISLFDLLHTLIAHWRLLTLGPLLAGLVALGLAFLIPPSFTAKTSFFAPQSQQSGAAAMLQNLGPLSGLAGAAAGMKNPADQYVALLRSRSLQSALVDRFKLQSKYQSPLKDDALELLEGMVGINAGKDGLIVISVSDRDPAFAASVANAYVDELRKMTARLALTEAQQRRQFFEKQLLQTKASLAQAELALKKTGVNVLALKANPAAAVNAVAQLQAQVTAQQVKLSSLRAYATESSSEVKQTQTELAALRAELAKISRNDAAVDTNDGDYVSRYRDVKYYETLFELFAKQFELAKVDEARDGPMIQVVDEALPPERKSKPMKGQIAVSTALGVGVLLLIFVFVRQALRQQAADPEMAAKFARLRQAWR